VRRTVFYVSECASCHQQGHVDSRAFLTRVPADAGWPSQWPRNSYSVVKFAIIRPHCSTA